MKKLTLEDFIRRSLEAHGDKYSYENTAYLSNGEKVEIICDTHGSFWQAPSKHWAGQGCPECANSKKGSYCVPTTESFVEDLVKTHGDKYDYSKVVYKSMKSKIIIICQNHGQFLQIAWEHKQGSGCPECFKERRGANIWPNTMYHEYGNTSHLYVMLFQNQEERFIKVGVSVDPHDRMAHTNRHSGRRYNIEIIKTFKGCAREVFLLEGKVLRKKFKEFSHTPLEPFPGSTECLKSEVAEEVIEYIENNLRRTQKCEQQKT